MKHQSETYRQDVLHVATAFAMTTGTPDHTMTRQVIQDAIWFIEAVDKVLAEREKA